MITNEEKIEILTSRLNTIEFIINSFIDHAEEFKDKYSLKDELVSYNSQKNALISQLKLLGSSWPDMLD